MLRLFHPALVHFAVALLVVGGVTEASGLLLRREPPTRFGGVLTIAGTLTLLPTLLTGYLAANVVTVPPEARADLDLHELNGWLVLGVFVGLLFWKGWLRGRIPERQRVAYAAMLLVGVLLVAYSALLGGELVYLHGVGVE